MSQTIEKSQRKTVKVANPQAGGAAVVKYSRAMRFVRKHRARMRPDGMLEFLYDEPVRERNLQKGGGVTSQVVTEFCGLDAFPGRPILAPSPNVLQRMRTYRGPLRPPVQQTARP